MNAINVAIGVLYGVFTVFALFTFAQVSDKSSGSFVIFRLKAPKNILIFGLLILMSAAALLDFFYSAPEITVKPSSPGIEAPLDIAPKAIKGEPSAEDISDAWDAVRTTDDNRLAD